MKTAIPDPKDALDYRILALDDRSQGFAKMGLNPKDAIADFDKAIALYPKDALAYYSRGVAKMELKQYHDAITDYDKAISLYPEYALAYMNRGVAKAELGRTEAAKRDFHKASQLAEQAGDSELACPSDSEGFKQNGS